MLTNGYNYLLVKHSDTLQKGFEGDWTVSFALRLSAKKRGVHRWVLFRTDEGEKNIGPNILFNADNHGFSVYMSTLTRYAMRSWWTPPLPIGVWI